MWCCCCQVRLRFCPTRHVLCHKFGMPTCNRSKEVQMRLGTERSARYGRPSRASRLPAPSPRRSGSTQGEQLLRRRRSKPGALAFRTAPHEIPPALIYLFIRSFFLPPDLWTSVPSACDRAITSLTWGDCPGEGTQAPYPPPRGAARGADPALPSRGLTARRGPGPARNAGAGHGGAHARRRRRPRGEPRRGASRGLGGLSDARIFF